MKRRTFTFLFTLLLVTIGSFAQTPAAKESNSWVAKRQPLPSFIENKGQFKTLIPSQTSANIEFGYDGSNQDYYFTKSSVIIELVTREKRVKSEQEKQEREAKKKIGFASPEEFSAFENVGHRLQIDEDHLVINFLDANPNVNILVEEKDHSYHNYSFFTENGELVNANELRSWKKLTYQNLYPNIDIVYEIHPVSGFKYSVIVRPGGDISKIKLEYSKNIQLHADGTISTPTRFGNIIDHAPLTFYADDHSEIVASNYKVQNNIISFDVPNYDLTQTLVIDPWTQMPNFVSTGWDCVWECERDGAGNVYVIGGTSPMQLIKYNSGGVAQWTYNTPYDTTSWLGTFAVDNAGNSYVSNGSTARMFKVNTAGALQWNNNSPTGGGLLMEFWNITFNCDQTRLVIGGTDGFLNPEPWVFDMNMTNGNVISKKKVHNGSSLFNSQEVRTIAACNNSKYYFLSHDSIGWLHQNFTACSGSPSSTYKISSGADLSYKCENWRYDNSGIMALAHYNGFVFVHRGNQLQKRVFLTGAIVGTVAIPGGTFTGGFGGNVVGCSGIDIDNCGNVFVGSINGVHKFDQSLALLASYATTFNVYDVEVNSGGEVIAGGSTGTSGSGARTGYIISVAGAACVPQAIVCCDATICPIAALCTNSLPVALTVTTLGGTFSSSCGACINATTGVFNPATAGVGTHTVTYTLACGSETISITVNNCTAVSVCEEANGSLTVSGGTDPYNWYTWSAGSSTPIGNSAQCTACGHTWFFGACHSGGAFGPVVTACVVPAGWVLLATGVNIAAPATYPIEVRDAIGGIVNIAGPGIVPLCSGGCPTLTVTPSAQVNVACFGQSTGSFSVTTSGGASPYDYVLKIGATTIATYNNVAGAQAFTGLAAATYSITVTDNNNCTGTATVIITEPAAFTTGITGTTTICAGQNTTLTASPGSVFAWSGGLGTGASKNVAPASTTAYTVTATNASGCTATATTTVTVNSLSTSPTIGALGSSYCPNTTITISAAGGTAGTGSNINWYTGPNGTGSFLGTGASINYTTSSTTTIYARREGTCNNTADASALVNVKYYVYATNATSTSSYCTDNANWHHFYVGDEIIYSLEGDLSGMPVNFPVVTIWENSAWYQETEGPFLPSQCVSGLTPGEERFEMERSWNVNTGGGTLIPPYNARFYYQPLERTAIETAAINHMSTYTACSYTYKYGTPLGFYWFKNTAGDYTAPDYDSPLHLTGAGGTTPNSINYAQISGLTSFSGGSGAVILIPDPLLNTKWLYFTGETDNKTNFLRWATETEQNSDYFNIQRSQDAVHFTTIGASPAQGHSNTTQHYTFDDVNPFKGENYYRLELVGTDGSIAYSNTIRLMIIDNGLGYNFYPNPTGDIVYYQYQTAEKEELRIEVLDVLGKQIRNFNVTSQVGLNNIPVDLSEFPASSYIVRVHRLSSGITHTAKVIKDKF